MLTGCAAVVQGGASIAAGNAKSHPAAQVFVVGMGKGDTFNASMRALTAKGRKITSSDRESGIVQGEFDDDAVMIKVAESSLGQSTVNITVAYNQTYLYGSAKLEEALNVLKLEIQAAADNKKEEVVNAPALSADATASTAAVTKPKKRSKKLSKAVVQQ